MGHNNIMKKFLIPLLCLSSGTVLASESNCDYKTVVNTDFQGTITSSKNYNKTTYPHVEDTRKCIIKLDVKINKAWYPTSGTYIFGPDMTENAACKRADVRAKESILREVVPENLNRTMNQNCAVHVRTVPVKKAPVLKVQIKKVANRSNGMWRESGWKNIYTPLTKGCIHSNTQSKVVWINGKKQFAYKEVCRVK